MNFDQEVLNILIGGQELISEESRWTQTHYARNSGGDPVPPADKSAVCYCSIGAIAKMCNDGNVGRVYDDHSTANRAREYLAQAMGDYVTSVNDTRDHEDIMKYWDTAINIARLELAKNKE